MTILKGILFVICLFMGIFFTVFVLTAVEAKSQKFQNFAGKVLSQLNGLSFDLLGAPPAQ